MKQTPFTPDGLKMYDDENPLDALIKAWSVPGKNPMWYIRARVLVREQMPLVARALDRLVKESQNE